VVFADTLSLNAKVQELIFSKPQVKSINPIQVFRFFKKRYKAHFKTKSRLSISCWKEFFAELFFDLIGVTYFLISKVFF